MADTLSRSTFCAAPLCASPRKHLRVDEQAIAIDSDLSADMEISAEELDAIARLVGDDLRAFLSRI
jgi:hypothetical protein